MLNAQNAGAILAIIYDDIIGEDIKNIFPVERDINMLHKIRIPSLIISNEDGKHFLEYLQSNG